MSQRRCTAVLTRRLPFSNSSLITTFVTLEDGRLDAIAKGCRRPRSPLQGCLDYGIEGELLYYERPGGALNIVSQFSPETERPALRTDCIAFAGAAFLGEIASALAAPHQPAPEIFQALQSGLDTLCRCPDVDKAILRHAQDLLSAAGFAPLWDRCAACGAVQEQTPTLLAPERGGVICSACYATAQALPLAAGTVQALACLATAEARVANRLHLSAQARRAALETLLTLCECHCAKRLRSGHFLLRIRQQGDRRHVA